MNSIHTSWVERFYIILFAVFSPASEKNLLGPASEKSLTQAQGPNFCCEDKQQENLSRGFIIQDTNAATINMRQLSRSKQSAPC